MKHKYQVLLLVCWVIYVICALFKLCGLNWFKAEVDNDTLIMISNYIDDNFIIKVIVACLNNLVLSSLTVFAMLREKFYTKLQACLFIPVIIAMSVVSWFNYTAQIVLNVICLVVLPLLFKGKWYNIVLGIVLLIVFQVLSLYIKDIGQRNLNYTDTLTSLLLQVDTYVMVFIYYLYSNALKKGD